MKYLLIASVAALLTTHLGATEYPDRTVGVSLDGMPCVTDEGAGRMYFTLLPETSDVFTATMSRSDGSNDSVWIDGKGYLPGEKVTVSDWHKDNHVLALKGAGGKVKSWQLRFTTLPLVCVETGGITLDNKTFMTRKYKGLFTLLDAQKRTDGIHYLFRHEAGLRVRGATAAGFKKKALSVEMWGPDSAEVDTTLLGIRRDGDWVLDAMYIDRARMRNRVLTDLWNDIEDLPYGKDNAYQFNGTHGYFVEVFINGKYFGLYCLTDKVDRKKLNLKKTKDNGDGTFEQRGLLYKGRKWTEATCLFNYKAGDRQDTLMWDGWEQMYPADYQRQACWKPLCDLIEVVGPKINPDFNKFEKEMDKHLYIDNVIDYMLLVYSFHVADNLIKNTYLSVRNVKNDERMLLTPWDMDTSFGRSCGGDDQSDATAISKNFHGKCGLFFRLLKSNPNNYQAKLHDRWNELKVGAFSPDSIRKRLVAYRDLFVSSGAWAREHEAWLSMAGESLDEEIAFMMKWYTMNYGVMETLLKDFPTGIQSVTMSPAEVLPMMSISQWNGDLRISSTATGKAEVTVWGAGGQCVYQGKTLPAVVPGLSKGFYMVRLTVDGRSVTRKVSVDS